MAKDIEHFKCVSDICVSLSENMILVLLYRFWNGVICFLDVHFAEKAEKWGSLELLTYKIDSFWRLLAIIRTHMQKQCILQFDEGRLFLVTMRVLPTETGI